HRTCHPWLVERATVGDGRVGGSKLQWADQDVALADREVDRLVGTPLEALHTVLVGEPFEVGGPGRIGLGDLRVTLLGPFAVDLLGLLPEGTLPLPVRDAPTGLVGQVDPGR